MKQNSKLLKLTLNGKRMAGSMLLEVVLAIAVFAFGMLALVQLQGNLTRSSADANTRTVATNIAEEVIENIAHAYFIFCGFISFFSIPKNRSKQSNRL